MKRFQSQAGFGETLLAVLVAMALAGAALGLATIQDLADLKNGNWNKKPEQQASSGRVAEYPFVGSAPWHNDSQKACVLRKANGVGLTWTDKGWRADGVVQRPSITGDYYADVGALDAYRAQVESYADSRADEWAGCLSELPSTSSTNRAREPEPDVPWEGAYDMQFTGASGICIPQHNGVVQVSKQGNKARFQEGAIYYDADIASDYSISLSGYDSTNSRVDASGRFEAGTGGDVIFRGSSAATLGSGDNAKVCSYDLFGKKRR